MQDQSRTSGSIMDGQAYSDAQSAGQRLIVGFDGTEFNDDLMFLIDTLKVGGIILFARNLSSPDRIRSLCQSVQQYAGSCGQPPLFIAIDQEGGEVARLKEPFTQFSGNPGMESHAQAERFAKVTASELARVGINMNMAPVMDVAPQNCNSVMAGRAFGHDPAWVADLGVKVIENLQKNHIISVTKHFPGIGRTSLDSHLDLPELDIDLATLESTDLFPFQAAIDCGVAGIMLAHVHYRPLDPDWPASLSKILTRKILRDRMGFDGLVLTDDLDMGAIAKHYDIKTVTRRITDAGIDIALICHRSAKIESAFETIVKGFRDSERLRAMGDESMLRILRLKQKYCKRSQVQGSGFNVQG